MTDIAFPLRVDARGRVAVTDLDRHLRDMIEQVVFTSPGERVNRPNFGSGLLRQVFEPGGNEIAATLQYLVEGSLQQWLGDVIEVETVDVTAVEANLTVTVAYRSRLSGQRGQASFTQGARP